MFKAVQAQFAHRAFGSRCSLLIAVFCSLLAAEGRAAQTTFFLRTNSAGNFLSVSRPTSAVSLAVASGPLDRTNFVELGTWPAAGAGPAFDLTNVVSLKTWIARSGSISAGTNLFDLRAELLKNGLTVPSATGLVAYARSVQTYSNKASAVTLAFG